ncbi:helix-turn-helix domain-containing protein [Mesoterricola sediminis]|uniref:HTH cro/C1-type domain-containing protein n=1 Tax=Mesoterricola sediminis TaxID=2927980 RepID=A0AA48GU74_9BACT|nr:helix-turn-helix transcriptional regulator [Mesoterricola sediminis]BDU75730.1 hypothetical protein METESE_06880 [Mesoterricola sediminis]
MNTTKSNAIRAEIAKNVRALREGRRMTQAYLSRRLGMSQGRFSVVERGDGSFTAEQLVEILRLFNVTVGQLVAEKGDPEAYLHKALARLGAAHLFEDDRILPSEELAELERVLREVLVVGEPARQVTALAPVLIVNVEKLNLSRAWAVFKDYGLERRFGWLIDSTLEAIRAILRSSPNLSRKETLRLRKAERAFERFLRREGPSQIRRVPADPPEKLEERTLDVDVIGRAVVSDQTLRELIRDASDAARRWGVATALQTEDFIEAVRAAGVVTD